jgi:hypothetical protein
MFCFHAARRRKNAHNRPMKRTRTSAAETTVDCTFDALVVQDAPNIRLLPTPKPRRIDLRTLEQVRKEMSRVYRDSREGVIRAEDASRYSFQLQNIGKIIEVLQFESRIAALESVDGIVATEAD